MRGAYYNEFNKAKAAWLRHLIEEGVIAHGVVDERPIQAVQPEDLSGYVQCHFFAGVGVWSYAARLAGWPDDRPLWTGSCPCGPFSAAGKRLGFEDPRHLWPEWFRLVGQCRPDRIFGEQSDAADAWVDLVSTDLEALGYAVGTPDIPAAGFGGAHIRQRFYWVADADNAQWWSDRAPWHDGRWPKTGRVQGYRDAGDGGARRWMADADGPGRSGIALAGLQRPELHDADGRGPSGGLGDAAGGGRRERRDALVSWGGGHPDGAEPVGLGLADPYGGKPWNGRLQRSGEHGQFAQDGGPVDWLYCRDGAWRPVESGASPLVDETPARLGRLRGYGDAIDAETAANFIAAYLACAPAPELIARAILSALKPEERVG